MKRLIPFLFALFIASSGWARFQVDGLNYTILTGNNVELSPYDDSIHYNINHYWNESIEIPSTVNYNGNTYNVTAIGNYAFAGCSELTSVTIPNSITTIGRYAFSDCKKLTSITFPNSVTKFLEGAFVRCSISSMNILDNVDYSHSGLYINRDTLNSSISYVIQNSREVAISGTIKEIPTNLKITGFDHEFSITSVCPGTFIYMDGIIYYVKNETEVAVCGIEKSFASNNLIIPSEIECLTHFVVTSMSTLYHNHDNDNIISISIPNSIISIDSFSWWKNLVSVSISNKDAVVQKNAFKNCTILKNYYGPAEPFNEFNSSETSSYSTLFEKITLTSGTLDRDGLDYINLSYRTLQEIDLSGIENPEISDMAFNNCYKLEKVTLPEDLQSIGYKSFAGCTALKGISIPASVTKIDNSAFEDCRKMEQINFDGSILKASISNLETIGDWAFYNCHNLKFLEIPEGVTSIGDAAFYGCTYLQDLKLPSTLKSMGDNSFAMCENLKSLTVMAEEPPSLYEKSFYNVDHSIPVTVPASSLKSYEETDYWNEFFHLKAADATITDNVSATNTIFVSNGKIIVNGEAPSFVITATGQKIANQNLKSGVYFAMIEGHTIKIVIE